MVVAAWIVLVLSLLFLWNGTFKTDFGGIVMLFGLLIIAFLSATIIWEDLHSLTELWNLF